MSRQGNLVDRPSDLTTGQGNPMIGQGNLRTDQGNRVTRPSNPMANQGNLRTGSGNRVTRLSNLTAGPSDAVGDPLKLASLPLNSSSRQLKLCKKSAPNLNDAVINSQFSNCRATGTKSLSSGDRSTPLARSMRSGRAIDQASAFLEWLAA